MQILNYHQILLNINEKLKWCSKIIWKKSNHFSFYMKMKRLILKYSKKLFLLLIVFGILYGIYDLIRLKYESYEEEVID